MDILHYRLNGGAHLNQNTVLPGFTSGLGLGVLSINGGKKAKILFFFQFFVKNYKNEKKHPFRKNM